MPVHFMISEGSSYSRVGDMSYGGWRFISPTTFLNLLWIYQPCLMITGLYACHHNLVCFDTLFCCL